MKKLLTRLVSMFVVVGMLFSMSAFSVFAATADTTVILEDDFEYADTAAGIAAGWVNANDSSTLGTTEFVKVSDSDSHGKSMKITKNTDNSGTKRAISMPNTGKYQVKMSAYVEKELYLQLLYNNGSNDKIAQMIFSTGNGVLFAVDNSDKNDNNGNGSRVATYSPKTWMDISMTFDLDEGEMSLDILNSDTKQVILSAQKYTFSKNILIKELRFVTWNTDSTYIDDLSIAPYVVDLNVFRDDFEYADTTAGIAAGWVNANDSSTLGTTEFVKVSDSDSHGKSMKITLNNAPIANSATKRAITGIETTGKYKINMSAYVGEELVTRIKYGNDASYILNISPDRNLIYVSTNGTNIATGVTWTANTWMDISMLFDLNKGIWSIKITDTSSNKAILDNDFEIGKNIQINGLEFVTWKTAISYIDDISIDRYYAVPNPSVTMTDITGAAVDYTKTVTPGVKTITIDFGESMKTDTVDGKITLDGVSVSGAFDSTNQFYTITRTESLTAGEHTLRVSNDVKSINGDKPELAYELNFTSGEGSCDVKFAGVYNVPMGQSLAFNKQPIMHAIDGAAASGSYTLKYSFKNGQDINMLVKAGNTEESVINISPADVIYVDSVTTSKNISKNTWYDAEVTFTYGEANLSYIVAIKDQSGKAIVENVPGEITGNGVIKSVKFTSWNNQTVANYLDNVWFGPTDGTALLEDNFNGYDNESQLDAAGWKKNSATGEWKLETLIDENLKIKALSDIKPGSDLFVKLDYVNPGSAKNAVFIEAYYNDDMLADVKAINSENCIASFSAGSIFRNVQVTQEIFDEMAIYCWDSVLNMTPYADELRFVGE